MRNHLLLLFYLYLFLVAMVRLGNTASISPEAYWKLKLPYTPMPESIRNSLTAASQSPGDQSVNEALNGIQPSTKESLASTQGYIGLLSYTKSSLKSLDGYRGLLSYGNKKESLASSNPRYLSYDKQGLDSNNPKYLSYNSQKGLDSKNPKYLSYNKQGLVTTNSYGGLLAYTRKGLIPKNKQGLASTTGYIGLLSYNVKPNQAKDSTHVEDEGANSATKDQVFFVEKDIRLGTKKTLHFQKSTRKGLFLPREVSNQIPFQSNKVQETLQILSIDPKSKEAYVLSKRIELCEEPTIKGVEKKCVTSLESMVDYVVSMIGTNVKALTTQVEKESNMEYTFKGLKKLVKDDKKTVVCHKMGYPYAVFFCHRTTTIRSYMVTLVGKDGSKIEAVAACHKESNDFLDNYAKNVLKVVPGSTHICHFPAAEDTLIWVPQN